MRDPEGGFALLIVLAGRRAKDALSRARRVAGDARRRLDLARGTAAMGEACEQVRRHEAHLQRQLAGALALYNGALERRGGPLPAPGERQLVGRHETHGRLCEPAPERSPRSTR